MPKPDRTADTVSSDLKLGTLTSEAMVSIITSTSGGWPTKNGYFLPTEDCHLGRRGEDFVFAVRSEALAAIGLTADDVARNLKVAFFESDFLVADYLHLPVSVEVDPPTSAKSHKMTRFVLPLTAFDVAQLERCSTLIDAARRLELHLSPLGFWSDVVPDEKIVWICCKEARHLHDWQPVLDCITEIGISETITSAGRAFESADLTDRIGWKFDQFAPRIVTNILATVSPSIIDETTMTPFTGPLRAGIAKTVESDPEFHDCWSTFGMQVFAVPSVSKWQRGCTFDVEFSAAAGGFNVGSIFQSVSDILRRHGIHFEDVTKDAAHPRLRISNPVQDGVLRLIEIGNAELGGVVP